MVEVQLRIHGDSSALAKHRVRFALFTQQSTFNIRLSHRPIHPTSYFPPFLSFPSPCRQSAFHPFHPSPALSNRTNEELPFIALSLISKL